MFWAQQKDLGHRQKTQPEDLPVELRIAGSEMCACSLMGGGWTEGRWGGNSPQADFLPGDGRPRIEVASLVTAFI